MKKIVTTLLRPLIGHIENPEITDLPFVANTGKGKNKRRSLWSVTPNGNYSNECLIGRAYALEYLQYAIDNDPFPITWITQEMPKKQTGIEIGFLSTLQEFAIIGAESRLT